MFDIKSLLVIDNIQRGETGGKSETLFFFPKSSPFAGLRNLHGSCGGQGACVKLPYWKARKELFEKRRIGINKENEWFERNHCLSLTLPGQVRCTWTLIYSKDSVINLVGSLVCNLELLKMSVYIIQSHNMLE